MQTSVLSRILRLLKSLGVGLLTLLAGAVLFGSIYEAVARNRVHETYRPRGMLVDIGDRKLHVDCSHPDQLTKLRVDKLPKGVPFLYKALTPLAWSGILRKRDRALPNRKERV